MKTIEHVKCKVCGYCFYGYVPKGGDGSLLYVRTHKRINNNFSRFIRIKCPGSNQPGEFIKEDK